jgi:hypothetical protein
MPVTKTTTREALEDGVAPVDLDENPISNELITRAEAEAIADQKAEAKVAEYHEWLLPKINEALGQLEDKIRWQGGGRPMPQEARPQPPAFAMLQQVTQGRVRGDAAQEMRAKLNDFR